ncbi:peptidoglycan-binding domain-containing protein [Blautia hominis]
MEAVVLQYQRDCGLTVDGIAGRDTFMILIAK